MDIKNFEREIPTVILRRGLDYFKHGHVVELFGITATNWQAEVEGAATYIIDVKLSGAGVILDSNCDCPFDSESYCKHEVAVFYALQGVLNGDKSELVEQGKPTLQQLLQEKKKEELIELVLGLASTHTHIYKQLLFEMSPREDEIDSAEKIILHYISMAGNRGYIEWNKVSQALQGIQLTLERVRDKLEDEQYESALDLSLLSLRHLMDLLDSADDSSGEIGAEIEDSLACIEEVAGEGEETWSYKEKQANFAKIIEEALDTKYDGWTEWRFELLTTCSYFCGEAYFENKLQSVLASLLSQSASESWSGKYTISKIKEIKFGLVSQKGEDSLVEAFLMENLDDYNMREKVIMYAIEKEDYQKVLQFSIEGEQVDKALPGVVTKWKNYQYEAYEKLGNKKEMKEISFERILEGDSLYYEKGKMLYGENEWAEVVSKLLSAFDEKKYYPAVYFTILVEENQQRRLLEYCQKNPSSITSYYKYLVNDYFAEVEAVFNQYIRKKAHSSMNRRDYQQVCKVIRYLQKACGEKSAHFLIDELKQQYGRRPAFVDEVGKLK